MKNQAQTFDEYELGPFRAAWEVVDNARSGDIVEIDMVIFSKFAVHIGEGNIVYVTDPDDNNNDVNSNEQLHEGNLNTSATILTDIKRQQTTMQDQSNIISSNDDNKADNEFSNDDDNNNNASDALTNTLEDAPTKLINENDQALVQQIQQQVKQISIDKLHRKVKRPCQSTASNNHKSPSLIPRQRHKGSRDCDCEEDLDKTVVPDDDVPSNRVGSNDDVALDDDDEVSSVSLCSVISGSSSASSTPSTTGNANLNTDHNLNDTSPSISLASSSSSMMLVTPSNVNRKARNCINITTNSHKRNTSPFQSHLAVNGNNSNLGNSCQSKCGKSISKKSHNQHQHSATPPPQPSIFAHNLRANGYIRGRAASTSALGSSGSGSVTPKMMFLSIPSGFKCVVRCAPLTEVAANYKCRINNKLPGASQRNLEPLPAEQVVERCCGMVGKEIDFHMLKYNSEYYVTKWKYDCGWSDQASIMKRAVSSLQNNQSMADKHQILVDNINAVFSNPGINPPQPVSPPVCGCSSPTGYSSPSTGGNNTRISHFFSGNLISNFNYDGITSEYNPDSGKNSPVLPPKNIYHKTKFSVLDEPSQSAHKAL